MLARFVIPSLFLLMTPKLLAILMLTAITSAIGLVLVFMSQQAPVKDTSHEASIQHLESIRTLEAACKASYRDAWERDQFPNETDAQCLSFHDQMDRAVIAN